MTDLSSLGDEMLKYHNRFEWANEYLGQNCSSGSSQLYTFGHRQLVRVQFFERKSCGSKCQSLGQGIRSRVLPAFDFNLLVFKSSPYGADDQVWDVLGRKRLGDDLDD